MIVHSTVRLLGEKILSTLPASRFPWVPGAEHARMTGEDLLGRRKGDAARKKQMELPKAYVYSAAFARDGRILALGSTNRLSLWDDSGVVPKERWSIEQNGWVEQVVFTPDGRTLVSRAEGNAVRLCNITKAGLVQRAQITVELLLSLALSPDRKTLVAGMAANWAHFWDLSEDQPVERGTISARSYVASLAFAPDGRTLVAAGAGKPNPPVGLWDVATRRKLQEWTFPGDVRRVAYTPDGRHLITGNGTIYVLRLAQAPVTVPK